MVKIYNNFCFRFSEPINYIVRMGTLKGVTLANRWRKNGGLVIEEWFLFLAAADDECFCYNYPSTATALCGMNYLWVFSSFNKILSGFCCNQTSQFCRSLGRYRFMMVLYVILDYKLVFFPLDGTN